jgi:CCR4-NOT transcription complex subunit 2
VNAIVQQNQEFSIQNEDFPALPGYKGVCSQRSIDLIMHVIDNSSRCLL